MSGPDAAEPAAALKLGHPETPPTLEPAARSSVAARYDALLVDLDGVVYRADEVVPGASGGLEQVRMLGIPILFLTNNSSRTPSNVAEKLTRLGVRATAADVLTSAMATAAMLRRESATPGATPGDTSEAISGEPSGPAPGTAFVIGEQGIRKALTEIGIRLVDGAPERVDLVVVGFDRSVDYDKLRTAGLLVQRGARLIGTNADPSYPTPEGLWPGAGALLSAVTATTGAAPTVVGKPARPLFEAAAAMVRAENPLVVGDRLDTDIQGAAQMGWDSLLVLSGATRSRDLIHTPILPTYVGADLSAVLDDRPPARFGPATGKDADALAALLRSAGLSADGIGDRLGATLVTPTNGIQTRLDATACVVEFDGVALLRSVAVRADLRGKGLGLLAVAESIRRARAAAMTQVALFTETAQTFFSRLGFHAVDRSELPDVIRTSTHAQEECAESAAAMLLDL
jgi:HAD superfamily hydrolase (TIGR01450 family)